MIRYEQYIHRKSTFESCFPLPPTYFKMGKYCAEVYCPDLRGYVQRREEDFRQREDNIQLREQNISLEREDIRRREDDVQRREYNQPCTRFEILYSTHHVLRVRITTEPLMDTFGFTPRINTEELPFSFKR